MTIIWSVSKLCMVNNVNPKQNIEYAIEFEDIAEPRSINNSIEIPSLHKAM